MTYLFNLNGCLICIVTETLLAAIKYADRYIREFSAVSHEGLKSPFSCL